MREIKFRGKSLKSENWHYGSYVYLPDSLYDSDYLPFRTKVIGNIHDNPQLVTWRKE